MRGLDSCKSVAITIDKTQWFKVDVGIIVIGLLLSCRTPVSETFAPPKPERAQSKQNGAENEVPA